MKARTRTHQLGDRAHSHILRGLHKAGRVAVGPAQPELARLGSVGVGVLLHQGGKVLAGTDANQQGLGLCLQLCGLRGIGLFGNRHQQLGQVDFPCVRVGIGGLLLGQGAVYVLVAHTHARIHFAFTQFGDGELVAQLFAQGGRTESIFGHALVQGVQVHLALSRQILFRQVDRCVVNAHAGFGRQLQLRSVTYQALQHAPMQVLL